MQSAVSARNLLGRLCLAMMLAWLGAVLGLAGPAWGTAWKPEAPVYGIGEAKNVGVRMADGTVLRANVYYPTDRKTGAEATGHFPVVMIETPYGKDTTGAASGGTTGPEAASESGYVPYLIERGYIDVVAEIRGTGDSAGTFDLLSPVQGQDGATLVNWAARLPHANGRVGLYGPSYMGDIQFMTALKLGRGSPLKALFPIVAGYDTYRDVTFDGGIPDAEFDALVIATIFGPLEEANPLVEATSFSDLVTVEQQHAPALASYNLAQLENVETGGDESYDEAYWQARAPEYMLAHLASIGIPAYMVGGYFDVYQRGEPLDYSGLQNAYRGRPVNAPMAPNQVATGRYQLLQGPWYHLTAGANLDIYALQLRWFDRWLKNEPTGIEQTRTPLHLYELGANRWIDASTYPLSQARPTTFYLSAGPSHGGALSLNDGTLQRVPSTSPLGADQEVFTNATSPCDRSTEQWSFGATELPFSNGQLPPSPCANDDRTLEVGPGALTYTTAPFARSTVLAGPIDATIYASSTRPDTEFVATIEDVAPDGTSTPISSGALLGSFRSLDSAQTWSAPDGKPLLPYHPYTQASVTPVPIGQVTRFDIEVFPVVDDLLPGHRLRLTLTTSDTPHLLPLATQLTNLAGGIYQVQRNAISPSFIEVPLADAGAFGAAASPSALPARHRRAAHARHHRRARSRRSRGAGTAPRFTG